MATKKSAPKKAKKVTKATKATRAKAGTVKKTVARKAVGPRDNLERVVRVAVADAGLTGFALQTPNATFATRLATFVDEVNMRLGENGSATRAPQQIVIIRYKATASEFANQVIAAAMRRLRLVLTAVQ